MIQKLAKIRKVGAVLHKVVSIQWLQTPNPQSFIIKVCPFRTTDHDLQGFKPVMQKTARENSDKSETLKMWKWNIWNFENVLLTYSMVKGMLIFYGGKTQTQNIVCRDFKCFWVSKLFASLQIFQNLFL